MPAYRLFLIAKNGLIAEAPVVIEAIHDSAALIESERLLNDCAHEVWQGARLVGIVSGTPALDKLTEVRAAFGGSPFPRRRLAQMRSDSIASPSIVTCRRLCHAVGT